MKIICLGDSLTAGCGLRRGENWVELLREQTGDEWINAGVCGDTSTGILVRLQTEVLPQRPDEVLLMGGDNDIMLTGCADQAKSAMMAMIHQCAARGVKPVASSSRCSGSLSRGARSATGSGRRRRAQRISRGCAVWCARCRCGMWTSPRRLSAAAAARSIRRTGCTRTPRATASWPMPSGARCATRTERTDALAMRRGV